MDGAGLVGAGWAENTLTIGRRVEQTSDLYPQGSNDDFWFPFRPNQSCHICVWVMKYYWIMLDYSSLCVIHPNEVLSRFINYMIWCSHAGNHSFADHLLCSLGRGATLAAKQIGRNQVNLKWKKLVSKLSDEQPAHINQSPRWPSPLPTKTIARQPAAWTFKKVLKPASRRRRTGRHWLGLLGPK